MEIGSSISNINSTLILQSIWSLPEFQILNFKLYICRNKLKNKLLLLEIDLEMDMSILWFGIKIHWTDYSLHIQRSMLFGYSDVPRGRISRKSFCDRLGQDLRNLDEEKQSQEIKDHVKWMLPWVLTLVNFIITTYKLCLFKLSR